MQSYIGKEYYKELGVLETATQDEIKRAYRELMRKYHPDVAGPGSEKKAKAINEAYDVLSDPRTRRNYDLSRGGSQQSSSQSRRSGSEQSSSSSSGFRTTGTGSQGSAGASKTGGLSPRTINGTEMGSVSYSGPIIVNGTVMGGVTSNSYVVVKGTVMGNVKAKGDITLEGTIMGNASTEGEIIGHGTVMGRRTSRSGAGQAHHSHSSSGFNFSRSGGTSFSTGFSCGGSGGTTNTNGTMSIIDGVVSINDATSTTIIRTGVELRVTGQHGIRNGFVFGGSVTFNGQHVQPNGNGAVDLSNLNPGLASEFGGGQSRHKGRGV